MVRCSMRILTVATCIACVSCSENVSQQVPDADPKGAVVAAAPIDKDSNPLDGIWFGSWGVAKTTESSSSRSSPKW